MAFAIYISYAVLKKMNLETCLQKICAGVADAVLGSDAADIYICCVKKLQNLAEGLACAVCSFKSGILLRALVTALVKGKLFRCVRTKVLVDISAMGAGHAVGRPYSTLLLE